MKPDFRKTVLLVVALAAPLLLAGIATPQQDKPITKEQIINALRQLRPGDSQTAIVNRVRSRGVDFELTSKIEIELRDAGAHQALLSTVRDSFRRQGIELVWIPPGSFLMGSDNGYSNETPVHQVTISKGFYIGKYEVTQTQWQSVMGNNPSYHKGDNLPVESMSWNNIQEFIHRLNAQSDEYTYRLPSEAEWEYAARAGTTGDYAGDLDAMAWYLVNAGDVRLADDEQEESAAQNHNQTHPVGSKRPNAWGLFDMYGNVREWCQDLPHGNYAGAPTDGSAWLSDGDPRFRVWRGGSSFDHSGYCRSAARLSANPDYHGGDIGIRVVAIPRK